LCLRAQATTYSRNCQSLMVLNLNPTGQLRIKK
jgi:hypothetical protein